MVFLNVKENIECISLPVILLFPGWGPVNAARGKAGMDEATIVGLRERVHSGLPLMESGL